MSIATRFKKVGRGFKKVGRGLKAVARLFRNLFLKLFGLEALIQFERAARLLLETQLGRIAWAAVQALASLNLENEEKRRQAFQWIATEARAAGLTVKDSLINLLIEIAVQRLKGLVVFPPLRAPAGAAEPARTGR